MNGVTLFRSQIGDEVIILMLSCDIIVIIIYTANIRLMMVEREIQKQQVCVCNVSSIKIYKRANVQVSQRD